MEKSRVRAVQCWKVMNVWQVSRKSITEYMTNEVKHILYYGKKAANIASFAFSFIQQWLFIVLLTII
jgi:hypothetical protein